MKKIIAMALPIVLAVGTAGVATPVMADNKKTETSTLSLTVPESYSWSVPATLTMSNSSGTYSATGTVSFTDILLKDGGNKLGFSVKSNNGFKLNGESYTLKTDDNNTDLTSDFYIVTPVSGAASVGITASITPSKATGTSGVSDTLTFEAEISNFPS